MASQITVEEMKNDADWQYAFYEAYYHRYGWCADLRDHPISKVTEVHHAREGYHDSDDWLAVVSWSGEEGPFAVMCAGCDYTGWS